MAKHMATQAKASSNNLERDTSQALRNIGTQVEALLSQHSSLEMYRRSIERQLALLAARMHTEDVSLLPCRVFLLVEMRGIGGLSAPLEQIACVLAEVGYWKPSRYVQTYHPQDVYSLGRSAQRLFDDYAALDGRVRQLHAHLSYIRAYWHMKPEAPPQEVFERVAMAAAEGRAGIEERVGPCACPLCKPALCQIEMHPMARGTSTRPPPISSPPLVPTGCHISALFREGS